MRRIRSAVSLLALTVFFASAGKADIDVTYTINTSTNKTPISPYIYGINWGSGSHFTIRRSGGNRLTGYNWKNNFSNAGSDWYHSNDNYLVYTLPSSQRLIPGIAIINFHDASLAAGQTSIVTLQMAGYVSADGAGTVTEAQTALSSRWKNVVYAKGTPFCSPAGSPNTADANVYMDECVNFLVSRYGNASCDTGVKYYCLDNEPALWPYTHPRIHPDETGCVELIDRSITLAAAVKNVDPHTQILGPVLYGFGAYYNLQSAPDWSSAKGKCGWFIDYYLDKMRQAEVTAGRRLLDVLDLHWYPEAQDVNGVRITNSLSYYYRANAEARMQAPRSLWDYDYHEKSWIEQWYGQWLPILPPLQSSINKYYPGTKLSITEYDYGAANHFSGGIAVADVLGIFGKYGVYIATYWGDASTYVTAAFKLYRNYDGANSTFGNTEVHSTMSDKQNSSIYASVFAEDDYELHLIVINKNFDHAINGTFNIASPQNFTQARVWAFNSSSCTIAEMAPVSDITSNSFSYCIGPLTVCHIVLEAECPLLSDLTGDCHVDFKDLSVIADVWLETGDCASEPDCPDIDGDNTINFSDIALLGREWDS
jgi:hypothetical protein